MCVCVCVCVCVSQNLPGCGIFLKLGGEGRSQFGNLTRDSWLSGAGVEKARCRQPVTLDHTVEGSSLSGPGALQAES